MTVVRRNQAGHTHQYLYDYQGRLETDTHYQSDIDEYTYDANGNRLTFIERDYTTIAVQQSDLFSYLSNTNRLLDIEDIITTTTSVAQTDAAGNIITRDTATSERLVHNANGQLRQYVLGDNDYRYEYDDLGRRISKTHWEATNLGGGCLAYDRRQAIVFLYDEYSQLIAEQIFEEPAGQACSDSGLILVAQRDIIWIDNEPMMIRVTQFDSNYAVASSDDFFIHTDHLMTPIYATDASGALAWGWSAETAFGEGSGIATNTAPYFEINLRFPGQYADAESGLYYNYFRTYDPSTGRYLESDPIGLLGGDNTYRYASNDPLVFYDKDGLQALGILNSYKYGPQKRIFDAVTKELSPENKCTVECFFPWSSVAKAPISHSVRRKFGEVGKKILMS